MIRATVAIGLAVAAAGVAQDVPVAPPEIVVEGERPHVDAGMWRIRRWPTRLVGYAPGAPGAGHMTAFARGWETRLCIADGRANDAIARLLGDQDRTLGCSRLRLRMRRDRMTGSKSCMRLAGPGAVLDTTTRYRGTLMPIRIDVRIEERITLRGEDFQESRVRLEADRIGDCALSVAPAPADKMLPRDPVPVPSTPPVAIPSPEALPVAGSGDDIVIVARRLRKLRLRYASIGRILNWCRPDISSGDPRVDRIGCAIVRSCVRAGFGEPGPDIACFRRKVDALEP